MNAHAEFAPSIQLVDTVSTPRLLNSLKAYDTFARAADTGALKLIIDA